MKLVKELKKLNKKVNNTSTNLPPEQQYQLNEIKDKLEQATREKELAKVDVDDKVREQEAVKMIRFKVGFNKVLVGYLDLAERVRISYIYYNIFLHFLFKLDLQMNVCLIL